MAPSKVKHPSFKRDSHARRGEGVPPQALSFLGSIPRQALSALGTILLLSALCPLPSAHAQTIVPHRDIQVVDSLNRGKPTTAPVTTAKAGYFQATRSDGHSYWERILPYLLDSLQLDSIILDGGSAGGQVFYKYGTTDAPVVADDSVETAGVKYLLFNGLDGGLAQKIEMLKSGTLQFDQTSGQTEKYIMRIKPLQNESRNVDFIISHSTSHFSGSRDDNVVYIGWNAGPGGTADEPGKGALFLALEDFYNPAGTAAHGEFHLTHIDTLGVVRKPITSFTNVGTTSTWSLGLSYPQVKFTDPDDANKPYFQFLNSNSGTQAAMRMLNPVTSKGMELLCDPDNNNVQWTNISMSNPTLYMNQFTWTELPKTRIIGDEGTATFIAGRNSSGWVSTLPYSTAVDSLRAHGMGQTFYKVGTSREPDAISNNIYKSSGSVAIGTTSPAQTLHVQGTARITGSSGAPVTIAGRDGDGDINTIYPGPGLDLTDNVLSITPTGQDSVFISGDSICVIDILGDTVCVNQDSFYLTDTTVCYIVMGDTSCVSFNPSGGNIYNTNGALTDNRTVSLNTHFLEFSHGSPYGKLRLNQTGVYPFMSLDAQAGINNNTSPMLSISGSNQSDIYVHFNGQSNEDYCLGQDKSEDTFVFGGGDNLTDEPMISLSRARDSIIIYKDMQLDAGLIDGGGDIGGAGQVLTSTGTETNWVSPVNLNVPISGLIAALGSNTIDNANYTQTWKWDALGAASGLKLSSISTNAASNSQKLFEVSLSGANSISAQSTFGGYFSNIHTGSTSTNYGVAGVASGGSTWNAGVAGSSSGTNGYGVTGASSSTSGAGVRGSTSATLSGWGVYAYSSDVDSQPFIAESEASGTTGVISLATLQRRGSSNPAPGFGGALTFTNTIRNLVPATTNTLASTWADTTYATRDSRLTITGINDGSATDIIYFEGDKRTRFNGRAQYQQGADVASAAGAITLGMDGNVFEITGTSAITLISSVGWQNGSQVTLIFTSTATLTDGTANSGTDIGLELASNANFSATADDVITLLLCEIGGTQRWREVSRSVN